MKIKISENEFYSIELPEEISGDQLFGILERLRTLSGFFKRTLPNSNPNSAELETSQFLKISKEKKWNKYYTPITKETSKLYNLKDNLIKLSKIHYHGSKEDKEKIQKKFGEFVFGRISNEVQKKRILPSEVGMIRFRNRGDGNIPLEEFTPSNKLNTFIYDNKMVDELLNI